MTKEEALEILKNHSEHTKEEIAQAMRAIQALGFQVP